MRRLFLGSVILFVSCFEPVVEESLQLQFDREGTLVIHATTKMAKGFSRDHPAESRLRELRAAAVRGDDFWARQIEQLDPEYEQVMFEYHDKVMVSVGRRAAFSDATRVEGLFRSFGAGAFVTRRDDVMTFEIYPARPSRATDEQRKIARRTMDETTDAFSRYLEAARALYRYLEAHHDRAEPLFGVLFEEPRFAKGDLEEEEQTIVSTLRARMEKVMEIFGLHESQPYTLDELSRLVFNPFPAQTSIEIHGQVEEVVGFTATSPARYDIPNIGLWGAIRSLEGKWLFPDPLSADFDLRTSDNKDREAVVKRFASETRTYADTPGAREILVEIEQRLALAPVYRIRWRLPESDDRIAPR